MFMSAVTSEAAWMLRSIAKAEVHEWCTVKDAITAVYRVLRKTIPNVKPSRIEDIWRGEAKIIRAEEIDAIREAAKLADERKTRDAYSSVQNEIAALRSEMAALKMRISCGQTCRLDVDPGELAADACPMDRSGM
jgi:uncharacterized protein YPO0396